MKNERGPRDGDGDYHKRRDFNGGHDDRRAARYRRLANAVPDAPPRLIVSNERVRDPRIRPHWFFDNMVVREENNPKDGESVYLQDTRGRFVGSAIYNSRSRIRARLFSLEHVAWDAAYVRSAVEAAVRRVLREGRLDAAHLRRCGLFAGCGGRPFGRCDRDTVADDVGGSHGGCDR